MDRISRITPPSEQARAEAHERWNSIAKPLGSLGLLESQIEKIAAIQETPNVSLRMRGVVVMCADNGVVCEGVTQSDSKVTALCAKAIADGKSNVNVMARQFNAEVYPVDMGISREISHPRLWNKKIALGTRNIAEEPAMTREQAEQAICAGINTVRDLMEADYEILITGEMGIGNTTTAAALASVLLNKPPRELTGRGAGLDSAGLERKIAVIEKAIKLHRPSADKPIDLLCKLGGFDIAGMVGMFLGGAFYGVPIVIDGVVSAAAACIAYKICEISREYMLPSHVSSEPAGRLLLEEMGLKAPITAELRLGEGTGGVLLLPLLDSALAVYEKAHKFDDLGIERYTKLK
ncbi:MAG: nicotinate-nucleotide--dimethylbenzimidazole phosphoribosyltransferase [Oscillospiraceae bacterium]|nr:nicotinate-nucleotide--dimethylbenzimidazole phosphoribosyltransferase [Oscillospiraceae bacterium]